MYKSSYRLDDEVVIVSAEGRAAQFEGTVGRVVDICPTVKWADTCVEVSSGEYFVFADSQLRRNRERN